APAADNTRANRSPRPLLAPVTMATRPSRRNARRGSISTAAQCTKPGTGGGRLQDCPGRRRRVPVLAVFVGPGFLLVNLAMVAFGIWVAVDASKYPDWAFRQARTQK